MLLTTGSPFLETLRQPTTSYWLASMVAYISTNNSGGSCKSASMIVKKSASHAANLGTARPFQHVHLGELVEGDRQAPLVERRWGAGSAQADVGHAAGPALQVQRAVGHPGPAAASRLDFPVPRVRRLSGELALPHEHRHAAQQGVGRAPDVGGDAGRHDGDACQRG